MATLEPGTVEYYEDEYIKCLSRIQKQKIVTATQRANYEGLAKSIARARADYDHEESILEGMQKTERELFWSWVNTRRAKEEAEQKEIK